MYQVENSRQVLEAGRETSGGNRARVSRTVVLLGLTSFFTDVSAEMVATVLPLYLVFGLGLAPFQFGLIDGLYQGGSVVVRVASGFVADRRRDPKRVAVAGYALSAASKLGLLLVQGPMLLLSGIILIDRMGKGIRTAPRDAMISMSSTAGNLAAAFGVHRALDTAGAMLGPLLAFWLLLALPDAFDAVFVISFCIAIVGLGILTLFVRNPAVADPSAEAPRASVREALGLLRQRSFRSVVAVSSALGIMTISDGFLYLAMQQELGLTLSVFPLLYAATALIYMILAVPVGRLADRVGRRAVFLAGYAALAVVYVLLLLPATGIATLLICLILFGAYYAMTDGVLVALGSTFIPAHLRGSGLGILASATSIARLVASVAFGAAWTVWGLTTAVALFLAGLLIVGAIIAVTLRRRRLPLVASGAG